MKKTSVTRKENATVNPSRYLGYPGKLVSLSLFLSCLTCAPANAAANLSYLQGLLASTPQGGWVQANTNKFSDAWPSLAEGGVPNGNPAAIVHAWSSFAWDSNRGDLLLFGGGHANYSGNEMYVWKGTDGSWTRGSLPSRLERFGSTPTVFIIDNAAPQSAHTYDNNIYLPINDMFVTFGGAAFNSGGEFVVKGSDGKPVAAGPWMWDPTKADASKVGGTDGSGYNPNSLGGTMWSNQNGQWVGATGSSHTEGYTAYRQENGKDVIYVAGPGGGGWPSLYRYQVGNVRAGELGVYEKVGIAWNAPSFQGTATIDTDNGLYIRTTSVNGFQKGLAIWDLSKSNAANPDSNRDIAIKLVNTDGSQFLMNVDFGIDYDSASHKILMWDGSSKGKVWSVEVAKDSDGKVLPTWTVTELPSTTFAEPSGSFQTGVLGKWKYVSELNAYVALNEFSDVTKDAEVWLYKPFTAAVPEPGIYLMMLAGLGLMGWMSRRRLVG